MKLSSEEINKLKLLLSTCSSMNVDSIVIIDGVVRGMNDDKTSVLISKEGVPNFGKKIGLSNLSMLMARLSIFNGKSDITVDAKESDRGEISSLEAASGRSKFQFRCTSTVLLDGKIPKAVNDAATSRIFLSKEEVKTVLDAVRVMGAKKICLVKNSDRRVELSIADSNNDTFKVSVETPCEDLGEEDTQVVFYPTDVFTAALKASAGDLIQLTLGNRGTLTAQINNHPVILLPQVGDSDGDEE